MSGRYTHPRFRIKWFIFVALPGVFGLSLGAAKTAVAEPPVPLSIIFSEGMYDGSGDVSGNQTITYFENNNYFENDSLAMSGTGDMRTTSSSSGYASASGSYNVFLTNTGGRYFEIADINTIGFSNLTLSFGVLKSTIAENGSSLAVAVSSDGTNWTNLTVPALPTGSGTAVWHYRTASGTIPATTNLHIRFTNTSTTPQFRIDDVILTGTPLTYDTISPDGDLSDWSSESHKLGANNSDGAGLEYFLTWDETYLYVAYAGGGANDQYNVAVDVDPDDTGVDNSGTTNEYCGTTFGADGKPDYVLQLAADNNVYGSQGTTGWVGWTPADSTAVKTGAPNEVEFRLRWSDLGLTNRNNPVGIYLWACNNSIPSRLWASFPPTNANSYTGNPEYLSTRIYVPTTDAGRIPRTYAQHKGDQTQFNANGLFSLLNGFAQIDIIDGGGAGCNFRVDVRGNAAANTNNSAVRRQYIIEPTDCSSLLTANMTLRYMDGDFAAPSELNGLVEGDLTLFRWDGSQWVNENGTVNTANNTVTVNGISKFSPWTFGTGSGPTAVSLQSFTAQNSAALPLLITIILVLLLGSAFLLWQRQRR